MSDTICVNTDEDRANLLQSVDNSAVVVRACAGAGKTGLIVQGCLQILHTQPKSKSIVITLTNSVRDEIRSRIIDAFPDASHSQSGHKDTLRNHKNESCVEISSADAFVHQLLTNAGYATDAKGTGLLVHDEDEAVDADDFDTKRRMASHILKKREDVVRAALVKLFDGNVNGARLYVDEFQDMDDVMCDIFAAVTLGLCSWFQNGGVLIVGDHLQNVFGKSSTCALMQIEQKIPEMGVTLTKASMNICKRCPQSHLRLVNAIFPERTMVASKDAEDGPMPILLAHEAGKTQEAARAIATAVHEIVTRESLSLDDVAVVAATTNGNVLFSALEMELNAIFCGFSVKHGMRRSFVKWFLTGESYGGINWSHTENRISMLSVHADKGKTHRLTVLCDVSQGVLPKKGGSRDVQRSLLYVGLTRSCNHLLITFQSKSKRKAIGLFSPQTGSRQEAKGCMGHYVRERFETLGDLLALCKWSPHSTMQQGDVWWPPIALYQDTSSSRSVPTSTVSEWAKRIVSPRTIFPEFGVTVSPEMCKIGKSLMETTAVGVCDKIKRASLEISAGILAQRVLRRLCDLDCGKVPHIPPEWRCLWQAVVSDNVHLVRAWTQAQADGRVRALLDAHERNELVRRPDLWVPLLSEDGTPDHSNDLVEINKVATSLSRAVDVHPAVMPNVVSPPTSKAFQLSSSGRKLFSESIVAYHSTEDLTTAQWWCISLFETASVGFTLNPETGARVPQAFRPWALNLIGAGLDHSVNSAGIAMTAEIVGNAKSCWKHVMSFSDSEDASFEVDCRKNIAHCKMMLSGRADIWLKRAGVIVEVKCTVPAEADSSEESAPGVWWSQVMLYSAMLPGVGSLILVDVGKCTSWRLSIARKDVCTFIDNAAEKLKIAYT